jgi:hypothetical protein
MKKIGVSENMVICVTVLHQDIQFFVRFGRGRGDQVSSFAVHIKGVRQGCSVSTPLFNVFFIYTVECIEVEGLKVRAVTGLNIFINSIAESFDMEGASCHGGRSVKYFYIYYCRVF